MRLTPILLWRAMKGWGKMQVPQGDSGVHTMYLGLSQLLLEELQGFRVTTLTLLQPLELLLQLPLETGRENP